MKPTASEIAKYIIASFQKKNKEISNLKLQKLLYYAQAWHLVLYEGPLFNDEIEAWVHGPVVPSVFREYKLFGWKSIAAKIQVETPDSLRFHLSEVNRVYGKFDAVTLERMTHREDPWKRARGTLAPDEPSHAVISLSSMKNYFSDR